MKTARWTSKSRTLPEAVGSATRQPQRLNHIVCDNDDESPTRCVRAPICRGTEPVSYTHLVTLDTPLPFKMLVLQLLFLNVTCAHYSSCSSGI